jgi:hypothetical protein
MSDYSTLKSKLLTLQEQMEGLEAELKTFKFESEFNREEAFDEIATAIVAFDDLEEILDRDEELVRMKEATAE